MTDHPSPSLLKRALRRHRRLLVPAIALMCLWQLCEALVPVAIGLVIDHAILPLAVPTLVVALVGVAVLFTVLSLSYRFGARLVNRAVNVESHTLRVQVAAHALNPRGTRTPLLPGEVLSIASADADGASYFLRQLAATCAAAVGVLVSTTYLFLTDWVVGVVIMVGVVLTLLGVQLLSPVISRATEHRQAQIAAASGQATDLMRGLRVIKGIGGEAAARQRYARVNRRARDAGIATTTGVAAMEGLGQLLLGLLVAVVVVVAGLRTLGGHLTIGELIAVVGVATFVAEPMGLVASISAALAQSWASARRITAYLATEPLLPDGDEPTGADRPPLQFRGFATGADRPLDLSVADRELVAVVTDDARTSSALAAAVAGSLSVYSGTILVGGTDRRRLSVTSASRTLAVAPHHADVFEGTIAANIAPGSTVTADDLADVLAASACAELVGLFDAGLDHELQAGGTNLSGGQRQRIALARALYADRPVLVLDDPTTAVDAVTEAEIARRLRRLRRSTDPDAPRATLVLTSSPAFLAAADRVVMISSGADPVIGAHVELMIDSAAYRELVSR